MREGGGGHTHARTHAHTLTHPASHATSGRASGRERDTRIAVWRSCRRAIVYQLPLFFALS